MIAYLVLVGAVVSTSKSNSPGTSEQIAWQITKGSILFISAFDLICTRILLLALVGLAVGGLAAGLVVLRPALAGRVGP